MEEIQLDVNLREKVGSRNVKAVRRADHIPAIVYGGDLGPTPVKVLRQSYEKIMRHHRGENVVFHLNISDGDKKFRDYTVILKDEQFNPVSDQLIHIDFQRISLTEKIETEVLVVAEGVPVGVEKDGGSLDQPLNKLDVIALPTALPPSIKVDVSNLKIGDILHVKDIALPKGVETNHDGDSVVFSVVPPQAVEGEGGEESDDVTTDSQE